ncbi:hypothetical protein Tco_0705309 [Tanacetum coccineum]|uniref:Uncharacterized protein n=1 Tax=Tanacetum coccineum TaxID=301880 RepID=A0ABQ4Y686_9ASTR
MSEFRTSNQRVTQQEISSPYKDLSDIGSPRADDHEFPDAPPSPEDSRMGDLLSPIAQSPDLLCRSLILRQMMRMDIEEGIEDADKDIDEEDEDDEMEDEEAEEEHSAPAYPVVVALSATAPSAEETEPFETDESAATPPPHLAFRYDLPSPLSPWSSSPPTDSYPIITPSPVLPAPPPSPIRSLGYRAATIRMRAEAAATSHSLPLPPPFILSPQTQNATTSHCHIQLLLYSHLLSRTLGPGYEVGESSAAAAARPAGGFRADYGFVATMDRQVRRDPERYVGYGITDAWDEIVETLQGAPGQRQLLAGRVNMLFRDRRTHAHTRQLMETEAGMSREAWGRAMDASDLAHGGVISLRTTVHAQMGERREEMRELRAADRTRQQQIIQTLTAVQTLQRETIPLQGLVTTLQEQGQQGPTGGPALPELPEDAGSSS